MLTRWFNIPGFPGYRITRDGRVKSVRKELRRTNHCGYLRVMLRRDGKWTCQGIHVLLALTFIGPPPPGERPCVRHLDDDRSNNALGNLAWGTYSDNQLDQIKNGRRGRYRYSVTGERSEL